MAYSELIKNFKPVETPKAFLRALRDIENLRAGEEVTLSEDVGIAFKHPVMNDNGEYFIPLFTRTEEMEKGPGREDGRGRERCEGEKEGGREIIRPRVRGKEMKLKLNEKQNKWLKEHYGVNDEDYSKLSEDRKDEIIHEIFFDEAIADEEGKDWRFITNILDALVDAE